ncbi:hypothetical protein AVEN_18481-1 [Araneus ventricosus]|uniref:Uncharacterized protein n=1 Tax=Araneus ventricosus TaxID=182803 RepID=A0A4Y2WV30_ARAVE|nr:hypothetical protein AVEN_18481-1 [Araneus ventricosus]
MKILDRLGAVEWPLLPPHRVACTEERWYLIAACLIRWSTDTRDLRFDSQIRVEHTHAKEVHRREMVLDCCLLEVVYGHQRSRVRFSDKG